MVKVLDACALIAYIEKEPGYEIVKELFVKASQSEKRLLMSTVSWGEAFYILIQDHGITEAERAQKIIETFPIEFVPPDLIVSKQAALYKAAKKLPYADCFVVALAKLHKGEVVTDDTDFKVVENEVKIIWIR